MKILILFIFVFSTHKSISAEPVLAPIITDRPSKTDGPFTVPVKRFQIEADIVNHGKTKTKTAEITSTNYGNLNLKAGLSRSSDIQLFVPTLFSQRTKTDQGANTVSGFGDLVLRYKYNLFQTDDNTALGTIAFVKLPTASAGASNDRIEGGINFPFATLFGDWSLASMVQFNHVRRSDDSGQQTDFILTSMLGRSIIGDLSGFIEIWGKMSDNNSLNEEASLDLFLVYLVNSNIQVDTGVFLGLTEATEDVVAFLGFSILI